SLHLSCPLWVHCSLPTRRSSDRVHGRPRLGSQTLVSHAVLLRRGRYSGGGAGGHDLAGSARCPLRDATVRDVGWCRCPPRDRLEDRKSTRLNSSHVKSSYAVFCW